MPIRDSEAGAWIRSVFIPAEIMGRLLEVDYRGAEVRVAACYSKDPNLIRYVTDKSTDMHGDMAEQIFFLKPKTASKWIRDNVKGAFVFRQFYGGYYKQCAVDLWRIAQVELLASGETMIAHLAAKGIKRYADFEAHMLAIEKDFWERRFATYQAWREKQWDLYLTRGYIDLLTGFRCQDFMTKNELLNKPIQGSAFHCLLWSVNRLTEMEQDSGLPGGTVIIGQVHDSMLADIARGDEWPAALACIKDVMETQLTKEWPWLIVPMETEAELSPPGRPWSEKKKVKE